MKNQYSKKYQLQDDKQILERQKLQQLCENLTNLVLNTSKEDQKFPEFQNQLFAVVQNIQFFKKTLPESPDAAEIMLKQICQELQYTIVPKQKAVFHYSDKADNFYLIIKGSAKVFIPKSDNEIENDYKKGSELIQSIEKMNLPKRSSIILLELDKVKRNSVASEKKLATLIANSFTENDKLLAYLNKDDFYFKDSIISKFKCIQELGQGDYFGELALTLGKPRGGSIVVTEDLHLFLLNKLQFKKIFDDYNKSIKWKIDFFQKHFNDITYFSMSSYCYFFKEQRFNINQLLWKEGEVPQYFFLIKKGQVELYKDISVKSNKNQQQENDKDPALQSSQMSVKKKKKITISHVGAGTFVGEEDFFQQRKRQYSAICIDPLDVYLMSAEDYNYVWKCFPDIMKQLSEQSKVQNQWLEQRINMTISTTISRDDQLSSQRQSKDVYYERRTVKELQNMYDNYVQVAEQECQTIFSPTGNSAINSFLQLQQQNEDQNNKQQQNYDARGAMTIRYDDKSQNESVNYLNKSSSAKNLSNLKNQLQAVKNDAQWQILQNQSQNSQIFTVEQLEFQQSQIQFLQQQNTASTPDLLMLNKNSNNNNNQHQQIIRSTSSQKQINKQELIEKKEKLFNLLIKRSQNQGQDIKNGIGLGFEQKQINQKQLELKLMKKYNTYNVSSLIANNPMFNQQQGQNSIKSSQSPQKKQLAGHQFIFNIIKNQMDIKKKIRKSSATFLDQIILSNIKQNQATQSSFNTPEKKVLRKNSNYNSSYQRKNNQSAIKLERNSNPKYQNRDNLISQINCQGNNNNSVSESMQDGVCSNQAESRAGLNTGQQVKRMIVVKQKRGLSEQFESTQNSGFAGIQTKKCQDELLDLIQQQRTPPIHSMPINNSNMSIQTESQNTSTIIAKVNTQLNRKRNVWLSLNREKPFSKTLVNNTQTNKQHLDLKLWVTNNNNIGSGTLISPHKEQFEGSIEKKTNNF